MSEEPRARRYTDREIGKLIQRASEIQEERSDEPQAGLSLQELEVIASDVGIAPAHLRAAAAEIQDTTNTGRAVRFWGGPFALRQKRFVDTSAIEGDWETIVEGLRRITGSEGRTARIGRSLEWTRERKDLDFVIERTSVTLRPRETDATIEVRKQYGGAAKLTYMLGVILGGGMAGIFLDGAGFSDIVNGFVLAGGSVGGLGVARAAVGEWTRRQREEMRRISDWMSDLLARPEVTKGHGEEAAPDSVSRVPLDTE